MMSGRGYSQRSLHGHVVHELGVRILRGDYAPGSNLPNEDELATTMQVSRTAMREAVKVLTAKGLIESRPRVGTRVRPRMHWNMLDPDVLAWQCSNMASGKFARDLLEMREMIEPAAAVLAARHCSAAQLAELEQAYAAMAAADSLESWVAADLRFHQAILQAGGNELLVPLSSLIETGLETMFVFSARHANNPKHSLPEHEQVLLAIRSRDEQAAFASMSALLKGTRASLSRKLKEIEPGKGMPFVWEKP